MSYVTYLKRPRNLRDYFRFCFREKFSLSHGKVVLIIK